MKTPDSRERITRLGFAAFLLSFASVAAFGATITVNSTADVVANDGQCTLREAITAANTNTASGAAAGECAAGAVGLDTIVFNIPGAGVHTISPTSTMPFITEAVTIDGYSQPGASPNTLAVGDNAVLRIEIDGTGVPVSSNLFVLSGASGSTVRGLVINRLSGTAINIFSGNGNAITGNFLNTDTTGSLFMGGGNFAVIALGGTGNTVGGTAPAARNVIGGGGGSNAGTIRLDPPGGNFIQGNYIGVNAAGTAALQPAIATDGVEALASPGNTIGGTASGAGNVILGTQFGIRLGSGPSNNNLVQGNFIGTNATGTAGLGGGIGISTDNSASNNTIGGSAAGAGNLISGNTTGIVLADGAANYLIRGNKIGTDITGILPIPNGGDGISLTTAALGTTIGGTAAGEGNIIAFNGGAGVHLPLGGLTVVGYGILGNSIFSNGALGITLTGGGPLANDPGDADVGANNLQNYPVISSVAVSVGSATISGTLNSTASTAFRVEFFANAACDPSGNGEGQTFIGFTNVTTNGAGNASFGPLIFAVPSGQSVITSTATDPGNNTSEFSVCLAPPPPLPTLSINNVSANEGNTGLTPFVFTVTLSASSASTVTVNFATADGTATAPSDYVATSGVLTFNPGVTTQTITVNVVGDTAVEPNETFFVNLSAPSNATIATGQGTGTIVNDDVSALPTLSINNVTANEGNSGTTPFVFTVTLSAVSASTVTVSFATADGTATAGSDYVATSGTLTFNPGVTTQTITVNVVGDTTVEPNETFLVNLSAPSNATIATGQGTGTIVNDDGAPPPPNIIIPTLSEWGLMLLVLLLAGLAMSRIRSDRER